MIYLYSLRMVNVMNEACTVIEYKCGHKAFPTGEVLSSREGLYRDAECFPCPECCKKAAYSASHQTRVFVNMQRMSSEMSALVLEVADAYPFLEKILYQTGYSKKKSAQDELTLEGALCGEAAFMVWRKEFWFAVDTDPLHVVALVDLVKDEVSWLEGYLPHAQSVSYLSFATKP